MSLKRRVQQIARNAVKSYTGTNMIIQNNNTVSNNNVQWAQIISFDSASMLYTVQYPDGTVNTVSPGGLRPLGVGDGVLIAQGAIVG